MGAQNERKNRIFCWLVWATVHGSPWPVMKHLKCSVQDRLWPVTEQLVEMVQYTPPLQWRCLSIRSIKPPFWRRNCWTLTVNILRVLTPSLIEFHGGKLGIDDAAIHQAVNMAKRYLSSTGSLPKSAVQVLDRVCALVRTQSSQASESWQYVQSHRAALQVEITALKVSAMIIPIDNLFIMFLESIRSGQSDQTPRSVRRASESRGNIFCVWEYTQDGVWERAIALKAVILAHWSGLCADIRKNRNVLYVT
jgi:hypothetical protein